MAEWGGKSQFFLEVLNIQTRRVPLIKDPPPTSTTNMSKKNLLVTPDS